MPSSSALTLCKLLDTHPAAFAFICARASYSTASYDRSSVETFFLFLQAAVAEFARQQLKAGDYDGLVVSAAGAVPHGQIDTLPTDDVAGLFASKYWSAYFACKHFGPLLADGGAVALVAGVLNRRPGVNCVPLASVNGALEGLTRRSA